MKLKGSHAEWAKCELCGATEKKWCCRSCVNVNFCCNCCWAVGGRVIERYRKKKRILELSLDSAAMDS